MQKKGLFLSIVACLILSNLAFAVDSVEEWNTECSKIRAQIESGEKIDTVLELPEQTECCCKDNGDQNFNCSPTPIGSCPNLRLSIGTNSEDEKSTKKDCPCFFERPTN